MTKYDPMVIRNQVLPRLQELRGRSLSQIEFWQSGNARITSKTAGGQWQDITAETLERERQKLTEFEALIAEWERIVEEQ